MHTQTVRGTDIRHATTPRHQLTIAADIRQRMAQDIAALFHQCGGQTVYDHDLLEYGWTQAQISNHAEFALRRLTAPLEAAERNHFATSVQHQTPAFTSPQEAPATGAGNALSAPVDARTALMAANTRTLTRIRALLGSLGEEVAHLHANNQRFGHLCA